MNKWHFWDLSENWRDDGDAVEFQPEAENLSLSLQWPCKVAYVKTLIRLADENRWPIKFISADEGASN